MTCPRCGAGDFYGLCDYCGFPITGHTRPGGFSLKKVFLRRNHH